MVTDGAAAAGPALNTLEYFVHHEDIRRAPPGWEPRELTEREQTHLFKATATAGKGLVRPPACPWRSGGPRRARASSDARRRREPVVVTGEPAELTMFLFGRDQVTGLAFDGPQPQRGEAASRGDSGI